MLAINPLLFLACIVLYAAGAGIRDHFRYKNRPDKSTARDKSSSLEVQGGGKVLSQGEKVA